MLSDNRISTESSIATPSLPSDDGLEYAGQPLPAPPLSPVALPEEASPLAPRPVFAKGWCFAKIFLIFVIGCVIGTYFEQILTLLETGVWESRKGVIYGPFNPIYGLGFAGFVLFLGKNMEQRKWYLTWLYASLLCGVTEYVLNWLGELIIGAKSWDYTGYFLNIDGRTNIPYMLFFGAGGFLFLKFLYPVLSRWIEKIPYAVGHYGLPVLVVFMCLNILVSYTALIRQAQRRQGLPPQTIVGQIYDELYTDEYLKTVFANMTFGS